VSTAVTERSSEIRGKRKNSRFKRIVISEPNYLALKRLGFAGDSFNDVISKLLRIERSYQEMKNKKQEEQQQQQQENRDNNSSEPTFVQTPSEMFAQHNKQQMAEFIRRLRGKRRGKCSMNNETSEQEINVQRA
jgi:predicted CopG family antitoxin